jgi:hypothetical protein
MPATTNEDVIAMIPTIGELTDADELFNHQIVNTHAVVGTPDRAWTEKAWVTLMRKDGTLQITFGVGKYPNRKLIDAFVGVQRAVQQRTIRAGCVLHARAQADLIGPLAYEVVEPFKRIRLTVAENAAQPIRLDVTFIASMPAFFERRDVVIHAGRTASDVVRYHQAGTASGWIEIEGTRVAINPDDWFGFRDHSWGIREHVGAPPTDLVPDAMAPTGARKSGFHFNWLTSKIDRPDGTCYDLAYYFRDFSGDGPPEFFSGYINESNGTQIPIIHLYPEVDYRASDFGALRGRITAVLAAKGSGTLERVFGFEAINPEMGLRLLPGLYGEWKGQIHGSFKGDNFLDGECIEDVNNPSRAAENYRWQIRDRPVYIREGANKGFGDMESIIIGQFPGVRLV